MTISLCMIVKNEEAMLCRCLDSVKDIVDEMIVVDTGSTDRTVEIAESYGARIFSYPWDGSFSNARNFALRKATMDWIMIMDADGEFEREDTEKLRDIVSGRYTATAFFCKTLSFLGDAPDPANALCNLNICLAKNHMGYRFEGNIHEQIYCSDPNAKPVTAISDLRIYHYGYMHNPSRSRAKRERNIEMIQRELKKRPDDPFMFYNLGNEYFAQAKVNDALGCYLKSYERFSPDAGFSPRLMLRIIGCCDMLGKAKEHLKFIEDGLQFYPEYTELEFIRGSFWLQKERYLAAIRSFKKCIKMGESPLHLSYITGVGTFMAAHMLCQIYSNLGETAGAMRYGRMAIRFRPDNRDLLCLMAKLLTDTMTPEDAAKKLARLLPAMPGKYLLLSDVFYALRQWEIALRYARKAAKRGEEEDTARYDQGACLLYLDRCREACRLFAQLSGTAYESRASFLTCLCAYFEPDIRVTLPRGDDAYFSVLERFEALMADEACAPLAADEKTSKPFIAPIFGLLSVLIQSDHFDAFEKARRLLNLVSDDAALMRLGKLCFHNGYIKSAYRELERSIKLTGKTDAEALRMMKYILDRKVLE